MRRRRPGRGFTLLEMVVSLGLVALILVLTAGLMNQVRLVFLREQRRMRETVPQHALQLLRHDLHGALAVVTPSDLWTSAPLPLSGPDGRVVLWEYGPGGLVRSMADISSEAVSRRPLPAGISGWRWRSLSSGLVDVELRLTRLRATGGMKLTGSAPWLEQAPGTRTIRLRVALRGALRGDSW